MSAEPVHRRGRIEWRTENGGEAFALGWVSPGGFALDQWPEALALFDQLNGFY